MEWLEAKIHCVKLW